MPPPYLRQSIKLNTRCSRLCNEGISTAFYSTNLLFEEVAVKKAVGRYLEMLKKLSRVPDDFALRSYRHEEANILGSSCRITRAFI